MDLAGEILQVFMAFQLMFGHAFHFAKILLILTVSVLLFISLCYSLMVFENLLITMCMTLLGMVVVW